MRWLGAAVLLVLGVAAVVAGGWDDSPGLQGIGVLLALAAAAVMRRALRRRRARERVWTPGDGGPDLP